MNDLLSTVLDDLGSRSEQMLADLAQWVAIPTGHGYEPGLDKMRSLITERMHGVGHEIESHPGAPRPAWLDVRPQPARRIPPTLVVRHEADQSLPRILIAGHIDTVHDPDGPFCELKISEDGRSAKGPGAADMKGGILVAIHALEAIERAGAQVNWTFVFNSDEETGSFHSDPILAAEARRADWGLAVEPALPGGALAVERMGSGQFMIETYGRSAHVGRDFEHGDSAVTHLARAIVEIASWPDPQRGLIINVGPLKGGEVTNAVPDYAACWGNMRFRDQQGADKLRALLDALAIENKVTVHHAWNRPAKPLIDATRTLADRAARIAKKLGQDLPFGSTGGVCDGNILQHHGLPTIDTLGVRGGGLHTLDEWVEVSSLVERAQLFAGLVLDLTRHGKP